MGEIADDSLEFEDEVESDYDESCDEMHTQKVYNSFSTLYAVALEMQNELIECKGVGSHWPPDSNDLSMEAALKSIPVKLVNVFNGWWAILKSQIKKSKWHCLKELLAKLFHCVKIWCMQLGKAKFLHTSHWH